MTWRGAQFERLYAEALGDGQDDTQTIDTFVQNALWSQTMFLATEPRGICWSPFNTEDGFTNKAGTRPYSFLGQWMSIDHTRIQIVPRQIGIRLWVAWFVLTPTGTYFDGMSTVPDPARLSVRFRVPGLGKLVLEGDNALEQTRVSAGGSAVLGFDQFELYFDDPFAGDIPRDHILDFAIRSELGQNVHKSSTAVFHQNSIVTTEDPVGFFDDQTTGNPDDESLEVMALRVQQDDGSFLPVNMVGSDPNGIKAGDYSDTYVFETIPGRVNSGSGVNASLREITFAAPRALVWEPIFDRESAGSMVQAAMRPNVAFGSSPALTQFEALRQLWTRPRVISAGTPGNLNLPSPGLQSRGYRKCWASQRGDAAANSNWESDSIFLTTKNPKIRVEAWFICAQIRTTSFPFGGVAEDSRIEADVLRTVWDLGLVLEQLDDVPGGDADWSTDVTEYASYDESHVFQNHGASRHNAPILHTIYHYSDGSFPYKEGGTLLDVGDAEFVQRLSFEMDVTGMTDDELRRPFRLRMTADHNSASALNEYHGTNADNDEFEDAYLKLGGWRVLEIPKETGLSARRHNFLPASGKVKVEHWEAMRADLEHHWKHSGAVVNGRLFDPPFETTSAGFTQTNEGTGPDLDCWQGMIVFRRLVEGQYVFTLQAYLQDLEVTVNYARYEARTTAPGSVVAGNVVLGSSSGAAELVESSFTIAQADAHIGGNTANDLAPFVLTLTGARTTGSTGYMWIAPGGREWTPTTLPESVAASVEVTTSVDDTMAMTEAAQADVDVAVSVAESYVAVEGIAADVEVEVTVTDAYVVGLSPFEEEIDGHSPIHWWRFDEGSGTAITDHGSEGADMTASAGTDNVLSWEVVPSAFGFDTALRVTNTDHAAENVNGGGTMSGAPGFDLVSDFTLVWFGRYPGEGAGTLTAFYTKTVGGDIEEFLISVNADTETLQVNFYDDTNTVRTTSWKWTTGVDDPTWWMFAITWDADGGTGGDPLITLYQFDSESGHSVRSETWDPGHTPNALGDNTPQSDFAVGGLEYVDVEDDEFVEWAHYVVFGSVLTEQNLKDIAALGLAWEEWTTQAAPDVNDVTETTTSSGTSHSIDMPATVDEGDLLLMALGYEGADTLITGPTGWNEVMLDDGPVNLYTIAAYSKMADGTEGGTTVSVSTSASKIMHAQVHRVDKGTWYGSSDSSDAVDGVDSLTTNAGATSAHDHPALSPSWAAANLPWLALTVTFNPDQTKSVSTEATGYANGTETVSGTANLATARKDVEGTSEDPSGFTWDANGGSVGTTLGVRPALSVPVEGTESFIESLTPDVWLDASDLSTLFQNVAGSTAVTSDDDPVRYWADKSGNGRYFRAINDSGTNVYKATGFNGLPCVRTSGASNLMYTVLSWAHGTPCTILMAFHNRDTSGTKYVIQQGTAGPIRVFFAADAATGTGPGFYEAGGGHAAFGTSTLTDEDAFAVVFGDSDQARLYQQNTLFGSWTDFTDFSQTEEQRLFSSNGDCDLAEYIFIPRELTTEERESAMSYLVNKWGL